METLTYLLVGFGLAMDCVAVSLVGGMAAQRRGASMLKVALQFALTFGFFQGAMAVAGYYAGGVFAAWLEPVDHWIAFALLAFVGGKMIYEAVHEDEDEEEAPSGSKELLLAGIATSIDALAVGLSYSLLNTGIMVPALLIGAVTAVLCVPAAFLGGKLGEHFAQRAEVGGGLILIAIGLKILADHLAIF